MLTEAKNKNLPSCGRWKVERIEKNLTLKRRITAYLKAYVLEGQSDAFERGQTVIRWKTLAKSQATSEIAFLSHPQRGIIGLAVYRNIF